MGTLYVNNITAATGSRVTVLADDTHFRGNLFVTGTMDVNVEDFKVSANTMVLGDASGDSVTITANTLTAPNGLTIDSAGDIALSADGDNITMDDGTTTVFDFDVANVVFKMMDDSDTGDYFSITTDTHGATTFTTVDDDAAAADLTFTLDGALDVNANQEVAIDSTVASITVGATLADGQTLKLGKNGAVETIIAPHGTPSLELYSVTNTSGVSVGPTGSAIQFTALAGGVGIRSTANLEGCIQIEADGGANETISIHSDQGTGTNTAGNSTDASINLISDVGGIGLYSGKNGDNAIRIEANGGGDETIIVNSNQGTGDDSISLVSDAGGITLTAGNTSHGVKVGTVSGAPVSIGHTTSETTVNDNLTVTGDATFNGTVTIDSVGVTAIQTSGESFSDNDTSLMTSAAIQNLMTAEDLDVTTDSGTIAIDLDSETLTIAGTANEIDTSATGNTVTVGLPNNVTIGGNLTVASGRVDLDADSDTSIRSSADDQLDFEVGGSDLMKLAPSGLYLTGSVYLTTVSDGASAAIYLSADQGDDAADDSSLSVADGGNTTLAAGGDIILDPAGNNVLPGGHNTDALGASDKAWSDLFLGDGAVINFDAGDMTITNASNELQIDGGDLVVEGTNKLGLGGEPSTDYIQKDTNIKIVAAADIVLDPAGNNVLPGGDSADDLGSSSTAWRTLYVDDIDLNGQGSISIGGDGRIDLDADDDTSIRASADDVLVLEAGGTDVMKFSPIHGALTSSMSIQNPSTNGYPALLIDNNDVDEVALDIDASNTTANVIDVSATSLTTGKALFIDVDNTATSNQVTTVAHIDIDKTGTVGASQAVAITGLDLDLNDTATNNGASSVMMAGIDIDIVSSNATGQINNVGLDVNVTGGDSNYAALFVSGTVAVGTANPQAMFEVESPAEFGNTAVKIENHVTNQLALDITALNKTQHVVSVTADSLMTGSAITISADALQGGSILNLASDSANVSARDLVKIHNDNTAAVGARGLYVLNDAVADTAGETVLIETTVASEANPLLRLKNSNADARGPILRFENSAGADGSDDDYLGTLSFYGEDDGTPSDTEYVKIEAQSVDVSSGGETGNLIITSMSGSTATEVARTNPESPLANHFCAGLGHKLPVFGVQADRTLTAEMSGMIIVLPSDTARTITLPADTDGVHFKFISMGVRTHVVKSTSNNMIGWIRSVNNDTTDAAVDTNQLTGPAGSDGKITWSAGHPGDYLEVVSVNGFWLVQGFMSNNPTIEAYNA